MGRIYVRLRGGLGNQMFQYAAGTALGLRLRRPVIFDTTWYRRIPRGSTPRVLSLGGYAGWQSAVVDRSLPSLLAARLASRAARRLSGRGIDRLYVRATDSNGLFFDDELLGSAGVVELDGYWQGEGYFAAHAQTVREGLALAGAFSGQALETARSMAACDAVGVHVRRGDYVSSPTASRRYGICSADYYARAAALMAERAGKPAFFVFSDDPDWARRNLELPSPMVVVSGSLRIADHEELWLMSRCRHFIIANSSFSWWAAWLSTAAGKVVVAPRRWFADDEEASARILPDSWTPM